MLGGMNTDTIAECDKWPADDATLVVLRRSEAPGGHGANAAAWLARTSCRVRLVGGVGDDAAGERLRQDLAGRGVDTSLVRVITSKPTGKALVVNAPGGHFMMLEGGANAEAFDDLDARVMNTVLKGSCLLLMDVPGTACRRLLEQVARAPDAGRPHVVLAPGGRTAEVMRIALEIGAPLHAVCNRHEAEDLTALRMIGDRIRDGLLTLVVTHGDQGAVARSARGVQAFRAAAVPVADTTGAGDAFAAAYAAVIARGLSPESGCRAGMIAGAAAVQVTGAWPSRRIDGWTRARR
ncbi:carbohydrate kinase family protein [Kineosporia babensis]